MLKVIFVQILWKIRFSLCLLSNPPHATHRQNLNKWLVNHFMLGSAPLTCLYSHPRTTTGTLGFLLMAWSLFPKLWTFPLDREPCKTQANLKEDVKPQQAVNDNPSVSAPNQTIQSCSPHLWMDLHPHHDYLSSGTSLCPSCYVITAFIWGQTIF